MKKRITVEQLQELEPKQQQKLREWWKPEIGDEFTGITKHGTQRRLDIVGDIDDCELSSYDDCSWTYKQKDCLPLLDIEQMIELLEDSIEDKNHYCEIRWCKYEELCDILWEKVKDFLKGCE